MLLSFLLQLSEPHASPLAPASPPPHVRLSLAVLAPPHLASLSPPASHRSLRSDPQPKAAPSNKAVAGKPLHKFYVDYSVPAADNVFDPAAFEKFLHDRIKVDGKPGQLGEMISIGKESEWDVFSEVIRLRVV